MLKCIEFSSSRLSSLLLLISMSCKVLRHGYNIQKFSVNMASSTTSNRILDPTWNLLNMVFTIYIPVNSLVLWNLNKTIHKWFSSHLHFFQTPFINHSQRFLKYMARYAHSHDSTPGINFSVLISFAVEFKGKKIFSPHPRLNSYRYLGCFHIFMIVNDISTMRNVGI